MASLFATPSSRSQTACSCRNGAFSRKSLMVQGDCKVTLLFRHQHLSPHSMASWGRFQNTWHSRFPVPPSLSPIHLAIIPLHIMCSFRSHSKIANFASSSIHFIDNNMVQYSFHWLVHIECCSESWYFQILVRHGSYQSWEFTFFSSFFLNQYNDVFGYMLHL